MEKRNSYYVSRKNPLTWLVALLLLASVVCRIAFFCQEKGTEHETLWFGLILPVAAGLLFCLNLLLHGQEHLYRSAFPAAIWYVTIAYQLSCRMGVVVFSVMAFLAALVCIVIYAMTFNGKLRRTWLLVVMHLVLLGSEIWFFRGALLHWSDGIPYGVLAPTLMSCGVLLTILISKPHLDGEYHPTWGDRSDGRRVRTLPPMSALEPYIMPTRNGSANNIHCSIEITELERYIRKKRLGGMTNFGLTHVLLAAYARCVAQYPGLNRFLSGQRVYSRGDDIQVCMTIKKDMTLESPDTVIKVHLTPQDDIFTVSEKFNKLVEEVKNTPLNSDMDQTARFLTMIPGVILKFVIWLLKTLDYFGLLPKFLLEVSPFHCSIFFTSMGSLGIPPIIHHLYDFGNMPAFCAFGRKRRATEVLSDGTVVQRKYLDYTLNLDERTVDGFYYAAALKRFEQILRHPEQLDTPPETVVKDID